MPKHYKVWIEVEECDEDEDQYKDIGLPICAGTFESLEAACDFADELSGTMEHILT